MFKEHYKTLETFQLSEVHLYDTC